MTKIRYNKEKINDVFKYVDIKRYGKFITFYEGEQYFDTWNFSVKELCHFIDRDIFLLTKSEQLPSMEYMVRGWEDDLTKKISLTIFDIKENILNHDFILGKTNEFSPNISIDSFIKKYYRDVFNDLGHYVLMKLSQEAWKYNCETVTTYPGEAIESEKHFEYSDRKSVV